MRVRIPGKISDHLWLLGSEDASVYLLVGKNSSMLINGGLSCIVPDLLDQFATFGIDESRITKILLLHSHFDHIGIAPFFKRRIPHLDIYASPRACHILGKPNVLQAVNAASAYAIDHCAQADACATMDLAWRTDVSCTAIREGERIDLGGLGVEIYETPGHSPCSVTAYVPELKALFPSDAGGLPLKEKIVTFGTSNFNAYERSLRRLSQFDVRYVCSDHYGYVCGREATDFVQACMAVAKTRKDLIAATYAQLGDVEETARRMADRFRDECNLDLVPYEVFVAAQRSMVMRIVDGR